MSPLSSLYSQALLFDEKTKNQGKHCSNRQAEIKGNQKTGRSSLLLHSCQIKTHHVRHCHKGSNVTQAFSIVVMGTLPPNLGRRGADNCFCKERELLSRSLFRFPFTALKALKTKSFPGRIYPNLKCTLNKTYHGKMASQP